MLLISLVYSTFPCTKVTRKSEPMKIHGYTTMLKGTGHTTGDEGW